MSVLRELRAWPILVGSLVDNLGTTLWGMAYLVLRGVPLIDGEAAETQAAIDRVMQSTPDAAAMLFIGTAFIVLGAYAAGRLAGAGEIVNGIAVSVISLVIGIASQAGSTGTEPLWYLIIGYTVVLPAGWVGGRIAIAGARRRKAKAASSPPKVR
jgi:hypothetical protein